MLKDRLKRKAKQKVHQEAKKQARVQVNKAARREGAPKLLKTAAAGGAGYYAGQKVAEKQSSDQVAGDQAYPPPSAPDTVEQLQQLAQMHDSGVLTDEEFTSAKQKLLAGG